MASLTIIIDFSGGSDGTGKGPTQATDQTRNDQYFQDKVGHWMTEFARTNFSSHPRTRFKISNLPYGYAAYERARQTQPNHVDRYLYGHPRGRIQSVHEAIPHFIHLHLHNTAAGCYCVLCTTGRGAVDRKSIKSAVECAGQDLLSTIRGDGPVLVMRLPTINQRTSNSRKQLEFPKRRVSQLEDKYDHQLSWQQNADSTTRTIFLDIAWAKFFAAGGYFAWMNFSPASRHGFLNRLEQYITSNLGDDLKALISQEHTNLAAHEQHLDQWVDARPSTLAQAAESAIQCLFPFKQPLDFLNSLLHLTVNHEARQAERSTPFLRPLAQQVLNSNAAYQYKVTINCILPAIPRDDESPLVDLDEEIIQAFAIDPITLPAGFRGSGSQFTYD